MNRLVAMILIVMTFSYPENLFAKRVHESYDTVVTGETDSYFKYDLAVDLAKTNGSNKLHEKCRAKHANSSGVDENSINYPDLAKCKKAQNSDEYKCTIVTRGYCWIYIDEEAPSIETEQQESSSDSFPHENNTDSSYQPFANDSNRDGGYEIYDPQKAQADNYASAFEKTIESGNETLGLSEKNDPNNDGMQKAFDAFSESMVRERKAEERQIQRERERERENREAKRRNWEREQERQKKALQIKFEENRRLRNSASEFFSKLPEPIDENTVQVFQSLNNSTRNNSVTGLLKHALSLLNKTNSTEKTVTIEYKKILLLVLAILQIIDEEYEDGVQTIKKLNTIISVSPLRPQMQRELDAISARLESDERTARYKALNTDAFSLGNINYGSNIDKEHAIERCEAYLKSFGFSQNAHEVKTHLTALKEVIAYGELREMLSDQHDAYFTCSAARKFSPQIVKARVDYETFIERFPNGEHSAEVKEGLQKLNYFLAHEKYLCEKGYFGASLLFPIGSEHLGVGIESGRFKRGNHLVALMAHAGFVFDQGEFQAFNFSAFGGGLQFAWGTTVTHELGIMFFPLSISVWSRIKGGVIEEGYPFGWAMLYFRPYYRITALGISLEAGMHFPTLWINTTCNEYEYDGEQCAESNTSVYGDTPPVYFYLSLMI